MISDRESIASKDGVAVDDINRLNYEGKDSNNPYYLGDNEISEAFIFVDETFELNVEDELDDFDLEFSNFQQEITALTSYQGNGVSDFLYNDIILVGDENTESLLESFANDGLDSPMQDFVASEQILDLSAFKDAGYSFRVSDDGLDTYLVISDEEGMEEQSFVFNGNSLAQSIQTQIDSDDFDGIIQANMLI